MSGLWPLVAMIAALLLGVVAKRKALQATDAVVRTNYAGRPVPVVLGRVLVAAANSALLLALGLALLAGPVPDWPAVFLLAVGTYVLSLVGALDDRSAHEVRGLRGHLGSLTRGRLTTGIWKLAAGVAVSILIAAQLGDGTLEVALSALVIALAINVTNALDVLPGRALRWSDLLLFLAWVALREGGSGLALASFAYLGAGGAVIMDDLGERGMLGDTGSNPLGLAVGTCLAAALPVPGLVMALLILLGLQIAAETVTISRLIEAVPPLRWFDRLGRRN